LPDRDPIRRFAEIVGALVPDAISASVILMLVVAGAALALLRNDFIWFAFALAAPLALMLKRRELAALALLPALLVVIAAGSHVYWVSRVAFLLSRKTRRNPK